MPDSLGRESLFVRLYFDRHIMARLALDLRGRGFDVLSRQLGSREYGTLLRRMLRLLNEISAEEMTGNFVHLERFK